MKRRLGFSMLELLIAAFLMGLVTMYLMQTFTVSHKAYVVVDQVVESQQNMRAIADLMQRDLRHAGFLVPPSAAICVVDFTNGPDWLYVSDADVIDPLGDLATKGSAFGGDNINGAGAKGGKNANTVTLNLVLDGDPTYDTDANAVNDSDFRVGGGVIVVDRNDADRGVACGQVTEVDLGANQIKFDAVSPELGALGGVAALVAIPAHEYRINNLFQLLRDGVELAQGIEDLQVAVFVDLNGNNLDDDDDEYQGDENGPVFDSLPAKVNGEQIHEVRVSLVVRTRAEDADFNQGQFQATENRGAVAGNDGFRRRVHTNTVLLRNVYSRT
jgi:type II secretory pathway pseudopilin PulG